MAQFPISIEDANKEIKALITDKGLDVITSKMIRKHLEAKFKCDFEEYKANLDAQIETCIMEMENEGKLGAIKLKEEKIEINKVKKEKTPSTDSSDSEDGLSQMKIKNDVTPSSNFTSNSSNAKIAQKRKSNARKADAAEDDMATAIKRRRSNIVVSKKKEKPTRSKEKSTKGKGSMFSKVCALSPELVSLLGKRYLRRSDVVKEMWNYLRTNNLQDPANKQYFYLDEPLKRIFGKSKRFKPFGMMGKLKNHVKDIHHLDEKTRQIAEAEIAEMMANDGESDAINESTSEQQQEEDLSDDDREQEPNDSKEASEVKAEAEESNISYASQPSFAKSEEFDEMQPSTSSTCQQGENAEDGQNGGQQEDSSDTSNSQESETSSDDSGHDF